MFSFVRSGPRGSAEECGLDKNPKSEKICLFHKADFVLWEGISLTGATREKQFKLLAFVLILIGQKTTYLDPKGHLSG